MSIKNKLLLSFANNEKDELIENHEQNNNNSTSNNSLVKNDLSNPANPSKKLSKKTKKRLIIWTIVILVFGGILAIILYFNLRQTEEYINNQDIKAITYDNTQKKGNIELNNGTNYSIETNSSAPWSYRLATDTYQIYIPQSGSDLPITFRINVVQNDTNGNYVFTINESLTSEGTEPKIDEKVKGLLINATTNWSYVPEGFNWLALVSVLLPFIFFGLIIFLAWKMMKTQTGGVDGGILGMGKSGAQIAKSNVKFSDVAGIKEEKAELLEIVDYLKNPQMYAEMGARPPRGVMLYGPPGTGKTLLAKAVAGEAGVPFLQISGSQFEDMLVGVGAKRVRDLFTKARKVAPAIIFIDEIDSVASKRGKNEFGGGLADQTINQLLAEMDGFNTTTGIVVMAATNRLDVLDEAILRPGRFDRHIQVNLPDIKEREEILKIHARNKNISKKVSLYDIARRTPGFSGAQLENVLNEATLLAVRNKQTVINLIDIDEAIDRVIAGPAKKSRVISYEEKNLIAYHEAGHALVGLYTPGTDVVQKITIIPRGQAAGYTMQTPEGIEKRIQSKKDLLDNIRMTLGGRAAEEVIFGPEAITTGASNDLYKVTNIVRAMVLQLGMSKSGMTQFFPSEGYVNPYQQQKLYSDFKAKELDATIENIIQNEYTKAKNIIKKNKKELDLIVETLLVMETILKEDIDYIHKHKKMPPDALKLKKEVAEGKKQDKQELKKEKDNLSRTKKGGKK